VPALQGLATTYRLERYPVAYATREEPTPAMMTAPELQQPMTLNNYPAGEQALQQVVRIRQQAAAPDPMALVEAVLDLGDWYTLFDKPSRSEPLYAHAFELLTQIPGTDSTAYFAEPKPLYIPVPGTPRSNRSNIDAETLDGFVELGFDITETGYVRNVKTLASEPPGLMEIRVRRSLRVARYRPAVVDGIPVASANQTYRHEFPYHAKPDEEPEQPKAEVVKE